MALQAKQTGKLAPNWLEMKCLAYFIERVSESSQGEALQEDGVPAARNQSGLAPVCGIAVWKHADLSRAGRRRSVISALVPPWPLINYCTQRDAPLRKNHMTRGPLLRCPSPQRLRTQEPE